MNKEEKLLEIKQQIEQSAENIARLKGKQEQIQTALKEQFGCLTEEEAEKKVQELTKKLNKLNTSIETGIDKLIEQHEKLG